MKILFLGAGGIGGYFGGQLLRAGADVSFLVRPRRLAQIEAQGLRIEAPDGGFVVHPRCVTAAALAPEYDLIVLSPKAYDLDDALDAVAPAASRGLVLPLLNGVDHLQRLDERFGRARVPGGVAHVAATLTADGVVRRLTDLQMMTVGVRDPSQQPALEAFVARCRAAPFRTAVAADVEQSLWDKWVFLATLAGLTTACRGTIGEIVATPFGDALARGMYGECLAVAAASGHPVAEAVQAQALSTLTAAGSSFTASMLRDLQAGLRTEHEHILGAMSRRAQALGLRAELVQLAYTHLAVQAGRAA